MRTRYLWIGLALAWSVSAAAMPYFISDDFPSRFFPGKYFESKGQFYLRNKDYRAAVEMFEVSGYWADKISQYNVGIMYFNGIGIPVDKVRGVAWLRVAAQTHDDLAEHTFQLASAELNAEQRTQAEVLWQELDAKYGDKVSLRRALVRYQQDLAEVGGSHLGFVGNVTVTTAGDNGGLPEIGSVYFDRMNKQRDELIGQITGHVTVGKVGSLPVAAAAKANASQTPITMQPAPAKSSNVEKH
ncbi:sel1 repeat family protein [Pseudolysobacter antarcticus]|uniref:Sel1 repeat family protein n=1 Tax=Pseudolysobacter antarcticus TaxID=2511995 RepID=A0A411HNI5_9GAMM|nr:sel1 repeat family protein [Pseudolysobacter antarcticus]QBB72049.1 sel1 repeat family protein [Pseudolysobacter antarcticus]